MAGKDVPSREDPSKQRQEKELSPDEKVLEASVESFPASDPPGWIVGGATADGAEEPDEEPDEDAQESPSEQAAEGGSEEPARTRKGPRHND